MARPFSVKTIVGVFLAAVQSESGPNAYSNVSRWLKPFEEKYGDRSIADLTPPDFLAYRAYLSSNFKPSTSAAYLHAAKRLVLWTAAMGYRKPLDLSVVKPPRQAAPKDKSWSEAEVAAFLTKAAEYDKGVYLWQAVQYLGAMRPTEILRLVKGEGRWVAEGVFVPDESKTYRKNGVPRHLIVCPTAMALLSKAEKRWTIIQTYWQASNTATGVGPHRYRHSAASHLVKAGASYDQVRLVLGHYDYRNTMIYARPDWQALRMLTEKLLTPNVPEVIDKPKAKRVYLPKVA